MVWTVMVDSQVYKLKKIERIMDKLYLNIHLY